MNIINRFADYDSFALFGGRCLNCPKIEMEQKVRKVTKREKRRECDLDVFFVVVEPSWYKTPGLAYRRVIEQKVRKGTKCEKRGRALVRLAFGGLAVLGMDESRSTRRRCLLRNPVGLRDPQKLPVGSQVHRTLRCPSRGQLIKLGAGEEDCGSCGNWVIAWLVFLVGICS